MRDSVCFNNRAILVEGLEDGSLVGFYRGESDSASGDYFGGCRETKGERDAASLIGERVVWSCQWLEGRRRRVVSRGSWDNQDSNVVVALANESKIIQ